MSQTATITTTEERTQEREYVVKEQYIVRNFKPNVKYYFVDHEHSNLIWRNVIIFGVLHLFCVYGAYVSLTRTPWSMWIFGLFYGLLSGLGITAGAHRLWSHRSYKARLPLQIFLMLCNCIAMQHHVIDWCRDHRLHHKASETDADPHNSNRGWFFAHMGWLMQRKHPRVYEQGEKLDLSDLQRDPVLAFQKRYYWPMAVALGFGVPVAVSCIYFEQPVWDSVLTLTVRFVLSLHSTWFVNSAAHIWGERDYNENIGPSENKWVAFGALGEGFHNYHHTFPYDYSTSEHGGYINFTTLFINLMCTLGLAHSLRKADADVVAKTRARVGLMAKK